MIIRSSFFDLKIIKKEEYMSQKYVMTIEDKRAFWKHMAVVGIPVVLQQLVVVCLNLVDTIMVGKIS